METIQITVPFSRRHLLPEIRLCGGKFDSEKKTWSIEDNPQNRNLKDLVERSVSAPSPTERAKNVSTLCVDLLNALRYRQYRVVECGDRIVIESTPLSVG